MSENILESFLISTSTVPSVYQLNRDVSNIFTLGILDKVPDLVKHDFYKLGLTESINRSRLGLDSRKIYQIKGKATFDKKPREALVSLLTFDYNPIATTRTDSDGNYFFDFLLNQDYIVIAEDILCEYNHSIQIGVKPVEAV